MFSSEYVKFQMPVIHPSVEGTLDIRVEFKRFRVERRSFRS